MSRNEQSRVGVSRGIRFGLVKALKDDSPKKAVAMEKREIHVSIPFWQVFCRNYFCALPFFLPISFDVMHSHQSCAPPINGEKKPSLQFSSTFFCRSCRRCHKIISLFFPAFFFFSLRTVLGNDEESFSTGRDDEKKMFIAETEKLRVVLFFFLCLSLLLSRYPTCYYGLTQRIIPDYVKCVLIA